MNSTSFKPGVMPKAVICYICGRGYGTKSIAIHLKTCEKKWDIEQQKKPPKQRKPCPQAPKGFLELLDKPNITHKDLENMNHIAFDEYNDTALEPCTYCSRTFNTDAFKIHKRICTAEKPFKPLARPSDVKPILKPDIEMNKVKVTNMTKTTNLAKTMNSKGNSLELQNNYQFNFTYNGDKATTEYKVNPKPHNPTVQPKDLSKNPKPQTSFRTTSLQNNDDLVECNKCGRRFAIHRISKHESVCVVNKKPKKVKLFHKPIPKDIKTSEDKDHKLPKWKAQHQALVENMRYMRKVKKAEMEGRDVRSIPPPKNDQHNVDLIECVYCARRFNEEAHGRHVKICMNVVNKPKPVGKGVIHNGKSVGNGYKVTKK